MDTAQFSSLTESRVVCPHCWKRFYPDEAKYISRHAELFGDPVLGEFENIRYGPREITKDREGNALDPKGWKMTDRACPRCHLQIPSDLLLGRPLFVSVVGPPRSGKTYFITSMVHRLKRELAQYFDYALSDADSHDVKAFAAYERTLFFTDDPNQPTLLRKTEERGGLYNKVTLDGVADVVLPKPFIFSLRPTESNIDLPRYGTKLHRDLVLYDNAGESFEFLKEKDARERSTQHLGECDAVFFTLDPLQDPNARQKLASVSQDPQITAAASTHRQDSFLGEVINRIRRHRSTTPGQRLEPVLAVCVQKFDVWRSLMPYATTVVRSQDGSAAAEATEDVIDHTSIETDRTKGIGRFDMDEINRISLLVRAFVNDLYPEFVALAEANFRIVRYFPVSALGTSPEYAPQAAGAGSSADVLMIRPSAIQPFRIAHPMLWLLTRMQLLHRVRGDARAAQYPAATLRRNTEDRFWMVMPGSQQTLVLDREYLGTWIVDPFSGEQVSILNVANTSSAPGVLHGAPSGRTPAAAPPARPSPAPPPPPPASKPADLSLKLPDTEPKRRGWFRR